MFGTLTRKNTIVVFMSVELMLNAGNFLLAGFAAYHKSLDAVMIAFFVMVIAAVEAVVGLAVILMMHRHKQNIYLDSFKSLK